MYLNKKLPEPEYMRIHISLIPYEIMKAYNPTPDAKGFCYVKIIMAINGLKQSVALTKKRPKVKPSKTRIISNEAHTKAIFR